MKRKIFVHWDPEGDFLEIRIGKPSQSYYEKIGQDLFERRDEKTGEVKGYAVFNFQKRKNKEIQDFILEL